MEVPLTAPVEQDAKISLATIDFGMSGPAVAQGDTAKTSLEVDLSAGVAPITFSQVSPSSTPVPLVCEEPMTAMR